MKISDIISQSEKPELYAKGTSFMWTDKHISKLSYPKIGNQFLLNFTRYNTN